MDVLRITIRKERAGKWPVVVELKLSENLGEVEHEDLLIFPAADYTEHLLALTLDPQAYGEYPGQALFTEGVQEIFKSSRRGPRRVILDVEDRELRKLSWHRLCYPAGNETWKFIAHDQNLPFSLAWPAQPDGVQKIYPRLDRKNIKALVVVANPGNLAEYELQSFDEGAAARAVLAGLGDIPAELLAVNVDGSADLPRLSEITGRLSDGDYAILHLVAHGQVKDSETILYLADEQGNVRPVPGQLFFDELGKIKQLPHLLFLASCDSAKEETGLGNLARRAREELGTPAVVAMSDQVPPQTAAELAEAFYHYFAVDGEADTALVKALSSLSDSEQLTVPVVYSQLEGSLFTPPEPVEQRPDSLMAQLRQVADPLSRDERRNRALILNVVWQSWIKMLEEIEARHQKLTGERSLIRLNKRWLPGAVHGQASPIFAGGPLDGDSALSPPDKPIDEIFTESGESLLITGQGGSGMSVQLLELARERLRKAMEDEQEPIPIILDLAGWSEKRLEIADWIVEELNGIPYRLPREITVDWLERNELLLLLDGLDRIPRSLGDDCVRAINRFTEKHFARIAVCSRYEDYITLTDGRSEDPERTRLKLRQAISLDPLTPGQINDYFEAAGDNLATLRQALKRDAELARLFETPLILYIMSETYRGVAPDQLPEGALRSTQAWREKLLEDFVERRFTTRPPAEKLFDDVQTIRWLSWLAQGMGRDKRELFHIERLQPTWLPSVQYQFRYIMASRMLVTLIGGTIGGLVLGIANSITEGGIFVFLGLVQGFVGGLVAGLVCGVIDAILLLATSEKRRTRANSLLGRPSSKFGVILVSVWIAVMFSFGLISLLVGGTIFGNVFSLDQGLQVGLILGLCTSWIFSFSPAGAVHELNNDIRTVERLNWSRQRAIGLGIRGVVVGLLAGLLAAFVGQNTPLVEPLESRLGSFTMLAAILMLLGAVFIGLAAVVLGGFRGNVIEEVRLRPNQGFYDSVHNAAFTTPVVGGLLGVLGLLVGWAIGGWEIAATMGLYGLFFGVIAGLWYGGFFLVQHITLRIMLARLAYTPRFGQLTEFLDYAARLLFLRKVGGGYRFIYTYLQEQFVKKQVS